MGIFSFLSGNTNSIDKVVSAGISGIDKLIFTEEEKADYHKKLQDIHLQFIKVAATESTAQSISRRMICLPVVYFWLFMIFLNVWCEVITGAPLDTVTHAIEQLAMPALAAIGFYVGRHMVQSASAGKRNT